LPLFDLSGDRRVGWSQVDLKLSRADSEKWTENRDLEIDPLSRGNYTLRCKRVCGDVPAQELSAALSRRKSKSVTEPGTAAVDRERFQNAYAGDAPPWDIGKPQAVFVAVADRVAGSVLDVGCGTGENALFFAGRGHAVTGVDFLEPPIAVAKRKAAERGLAATFLVKDALRLREWTERFDNAIDSGLFHVFSDEGRVQYVQGLRTVLKPGGRLFLACFSDQTPGTMGPRRVTMKELRDAFADGWQIESIEAARFEIRPEAREMFAGEEPKTWFMIARRTA
jgi:SAM-dependent methyltransferase